MYTQFMEKDFQSRALNKVGWWVFMSIKLELRQANLITLVSEILAIKVRFSKVKEAWVPLIGYCYKWSLAKKCVP